MDRVKIIAEAGVNHNGDVRIARQLVDAAQAAGADYVKFQTFRAEYLVAADAPKAAYQQETTGASESQLDMLSALELSHEEFIELKHRCDQRGIAFLSSPFDLESADFLAGLGLRLFKLGSGEITNLPLLRRIASLHQGMILSTGMCMLGEIEEAMGVVLSSGLTRKQVTLLHCVTEYPTPVDQVNLRVLRTIREAFGTRVGYSDHTLGIEVAIAAVAIGATVIEKHLTLDRHMDGPDHSSSLEPDQFAEMVRSIRNVEAAMGSGIKVPAECEKKNKDIVRKSIVASRAIRKGEVFCEDNITTKRPGVGMSPMSWDEVLGRVAQRDYGADAQIDA